MIKERGCIKHFDTPSLYSELLLIFVLAQLLNIDSLHNLLAVCYRWLFECLAATEFFNDSCALKFALEFLEGFFNVLAFFNGYDNHAFVCLFFFNFIVS